MNSVQVDADFRYEAYEFSKLFHSNGDTGIKSALLDNGTDVAAGVPKGAMQQAIKLLQSAIRARTAKLERLVDAQLASVRCSVCVT